MAESTRPVAESRLTQIEPDERLVVLARTMQAQGPGLETAWEDGATNWNSFGETYLGPQESPHFWPQLPGSCLPTITAQSTHRLR